MNKEATPDPEPEAADKPEEVAPQTVGDLVQLAGEESDTQADVTSGGQDTGAGGGGGSEPNAEGDHGGEGEIF